MNSVKLVTTKQAEMEEDEEDQAMEETDEDKANEQQLMNKSMDFEQFRGLIESNEDESKNKSSQARQANFIRKGTPIYDILMKIVSGEQAISFFAQHGNATPIKFLNCNRSPVPPQIFRPYDISVSIDEKELRDEYFTVSAQGVVHICPIKGKKVSKFDAVPTEFFSLSDWMQQSTMFNVLTSMKFFKHYLIGKVFGLWKGNVRFKMYNRTRQNLAHNLIFSRPAFLGTFLDINKTLFEMASVKTYTVPKVTQRSYELEAFMEDQSSERVVRPGCVKQHYNDRVDEITQKLKVMVTIVSESRSLREEEDMEHSKMGQANKNKSMVLQKEEDELKSRVMSLARKNYNSLGTFIRLIDYMVTETQVRINQESIESILYEMNTTKKYNINTQVCFDSTGLSYNPTKLDFIGGFNKLLDEMENVAGEIMRIITLPEFNQYIQGLISDGGGKFKEIV